MTVFAFSLACIIGPAALTDASLPVDATFYVVCNGIVLFVMFLTSLKSTLRFLGLPAWRAIRVISTSYFWLSFLLSDVALLNRDSGASGWYMISLVLLIGTVFAVAAAHYASRRRAKAVTEQVAEYSVDG